MAIGRFPSLQSVLESASETARRFPLPLLFALIGAIVAVALVSDLTGATAELLKRIAFTCGLAIPLLIAARVISEKTAASGRSPWLHLVALALLAVYFLTQPDSMTRSFEPVMRFLLLFVAAHLLIAVGPFAAGEKQQAFWEFNKSLFLRLLLSALYSAVLFAGLSIALLSADNLFGLDVDEKRYAQLWLLIVGIFNTWVFLAGVPGLRASHEPESAYPQGLKIFTQYILLPLVGLYLLILYAYEGKIVLQWELPKGWVSHLVLWFSVVGILSLLLLWPLGRKDENRWVRLFTQWFFRALIPLLVMLVLAISVRTEDYGITVNRYLVWAMAVGLIVVVLYFVFSKAKDIRVIPLVLLTIALWSAVSPLNAFTVSLDSQRERFRQLVHMPPVLAAGETVDTTYTSDETGELNSISNYLSEFHGSEAWRGLLSDSLLDQWDTLSTWSLQDSVAAALAFPRWYRDPNAEAAMEFVHFNANPHAPFSHALSPDLCVSQFVWTTDTNSSKQQLVFCGSDTCRFSLADSAAAPSMLLHFAPFELADTLRLSLEPVISRLQSAHSRNWEAQVPVVLGGEYRSRAVSLLIREIRADRKSGRLTVNWISGELILTRRVKDQEPTN